MSDEVVLTLWCQLAFKINLSQEELKLRDSCSKRLLELLGDQ